MASLQARHTRSCAIGKPWTTFAAAANGCTCKAPGPMYHVVTWVDGKLVRDQAGHNRKGAERKLRKIQVEVDEGAYEAPSTMRFEEWADQWLASLRRRDTTRRVYATTLEYAKATFGHKQLRRLKPADVRAFLDHIETTTRERGTKEKPREAAPTTLAKHLRQLGACLQAAKIERLIAENPVRLLSPTTRPKAAKKRPSYFTSDELRRLWPELELTPSYLVLCRLAATTGMRFGELAALRWPDVHLLAGEIIVSRTYDPKVGETPPKSGEARTVDLTPQAQEILDVWYRESGGEGLVFERLTSGHLDNGQVRDALYAAMKRAGIERMSERGGTRTFHSFRHSFARVALEAGAEITWVQRQLGHSSVTLTVDVYGAWSRQAEKASAARLAGAFAV
jgi:integrase